jgi:hypothetical protein
MEKKHKKPVKTKKNGEETWTKHCKHKEKWRWNGNKAL